MNKMHSQQPKCALICVGSELLRGKLNTHASHIARRLASIGLSLNEENTVGDELPEITSAIRRALRPFQIIFVSGGLGPTFDDISREAAAEATGHRLTRSKPLLRIIQQKFRRAKYAMPAMNARQADVLEGAMVITNAVGTAPGQWLEVDSSEDGRRVVILLPGPPRELYPMLEDYVLPKLKKRFPPLPSVESHLHFVGVPESIVDAKVRPIIEREQKKAGPSIQFTILAHLGLVDFDVFVADKSIEAARAVSARIANAVRRAVGDFWYGSDADYPLEKVVGDRFRQKQATLALAESCTGGMLASGLTDVPGSSAFLTEGWLTYSDSAKIRDLGVPADLVKKHGAVSGQVAIAMAQGARRQAATTWGLAITGIAGPGGATDSKPVGLVYIALASDKKSLIRKFNFSGDRSTVRQRAVLAALDLLRRI